MMEECATRGYGVIIPANYNEEKLAEFIKNHRKTFESYLDEGNDEIDVNAILWDYVGAKDGTGGIKAMVADVIYDETGEDITPCDDAADRDYLLFKPKYPWDNVHTKLTTKEKVKDLLLKYLGEIYDDDTEFEFGEYDCIWVE